MSHLVITIRGERPSDYNAILLLTYEAFLTLDYPGRRRMDEHYLVHLLQSSDSVIPELCFVAEYKGEIVGHILYTKSKFKRPDGSAAEAITFGPLSVLPEYQRRGVGAALVRHSMEKARDMGFKTVIITGVPDYYPKLGFSRGSEYYLTLGNGTSPDYLMVYELEQGYLNGGGAFCEHAPEFDTAENDDAGYEAFHKRFMSEHFPARLVLRPFFDADIALMERWLYIPHVAKWYKHPDHWLHELRDRRGEFAFLTHFIAEYEGIPIGFCQYYDCWFSRQHEVWNDDWRVGDKQGEIYSMDIMIGEPEYLRRGFGKQMTATMLDRLRDIGAKTVIVQPERENAASCRTFESCGLKWNGEDYYLEIGESGEDFKR